jgi:hypothetical protein
MLVKIAGLKALQESYFPRKVDPAPVNVGERCDMPAVLLPARTTSTITSDTSRTGPLERGREDDIH